MDFRPTLSSTNGSPSEDAVGLVISVGHCHQYDDIILCYADRQVSTMGMCAAIAELSQYLRLAKRGTVVLRN
jgi:hypothetical protein